MASPLQVRAAYRAWCGANPFIPINLFPDFVRMLEIVDVEPVDMGFKTDLRYFHAAEHVAARLRNVEPTDKILLEKLKAECLAKIDELEKSPEDSQSVQWVIPFSLYAAEIYEKQFIYGGMYKHASDARAAFVKLKERGVEIGPGTPFNVWRRCAMQHCVRALEKMLEVGMHQQWVMEMEKAAGGSDWEGTEDEEGEDSEEWETETENGIDDAEPSAVPGLTFSTSTMASITVPSTPPSKKARSTLRRMGEEDEDDKL